MVTGRNHLSEREYLLQRTLLYKRLQRTRQAVGALLVSHSSRSDFVMVTPSWLIFLRPMTHVLGILRRLLPVYYSFDLDGKGRPR
jgi:hypothetical protein